MNWLKMRLGQRANWLISLRLVVCLVCLVSVIIFIVGSRKWAVVNDAAQIDYVCFLMDHGKTPYRDIIEMNSPGTYLVNGGILHLFGASALVWRCFDLSLLLIAGCAMFSIAQPYDWLGGIYAGALFALFHGRDGPSQAGQRDMIIAVLLLCACSFTFAALRQKKMWLLGFTGACLSAAAMIKPMTAIVILFAVATLGLRVRENRSSACWWMLGGLSIPLLVVTTFLVHFGALSSYIYTVRDMLPFYARLGRMSPYFLMMHSLTPSIATIAIFGLVTALLKKRAWEWEEKVLASGIAFGAFCYLAQGKGFSYHRYPLFAFILVWAGIQMAQSLNVKSLARPIAIAGLLFGTVTAPLYARRAVHRYWDESYNIALARDLDSLGGASLSEHVQCFTTAGDCDTTLYRLKLVQSTGLIYDYFVFSSPNEPVVQRARRQVWSELQASPPRVIIMGRGTFPEISEDNYDKVNGWPHLNEFLTARYSLFVERRFPPAEGGVRGYKLYVLNPPPIDHQPADTGVTVRHDGNRSS